jgi:hypothetical protein
MRNSALRITVEGRFEMIVLASQLDQLHGAQFLRGLLAFAAPHAILAGDAATGE